MPCNEPRVSLFLGNREQVAVKRLLLLFFDGAKSIAQPITTLRSGACDEVG